MYRILAILAISGTVVLWGAIVYAGTAQKELSPGIIVLTSSHLSAGISSYPALLPQTFALPRQRY